MVDAAYIDADMAATVEAWAIILGEFDGAEFDWDTFSWKPRT